MARAAEVEDPEHLAGSSNEELIMANAAESDWISRVGRQQREIKGAWYRRTADLLVSRTDPDASPMKRKGGDHSHLGYQAHCVVDGGKSRIIPIGVLVTPFEVTENKPMLDMLWRTAFRCKIRPHQVTGDSAYGTVENIAAAMRRWASMPTSRSRAPGRDVPSLARTSSPTTPKQTSTYVRRVSPCTLTQPMPPGGWSTTGRMPGRARLAR